MPRARRFAAALGVVAACFGLLGVLRASPPSSAPTRATATPTANAAVTPRPAAGRAFARGMTVSCRRDGRGEWDGPHMPGTLDQLQRLGVEWISFHPYARISNDGSVRFARIEDDPSVLTPIRLAHRRGMHVMVKPHLGYWRSRFAWRGEIHFDDPAALDRFFREYEQWIVHQATLAQRGGAAAFCVGLEYEKLERYEQRWRRIIQRVRQVFTGHVTYGANWTSYQDVPFWDALDSIGIQAYFPLSEQENPTDAELHRGWDRVLAELRRFAGRTGRTIALTELGYAASPRAAAEPWHAPRVEPGPEARRLKRRLMRIALQRVEAEPSIRGVFLWKWFPMPRDSGREFLLQDGPMRAIIHNAWREDKP